MEVNRWLLDSVSLGLNLWWWVINLLKGWLANELTMCG